MIRKSKNIKKGLSRINRAFRSWFSFIKLRTKNVYNTCVIFFKTSIYNLSPSTIRFRYYASFSVSKLRKQFIIYPIFYIKKFLFLGIGKVKEFFINVWLYIKYICLWHWKISLIIVLLCLVSFLFIKDTGLGLKLVDATKYFMNSPNQDRLFDLYLALTAITGTFIGLYFTAISITSQTIYTKVNADIHNLLSTVKLSNVYIKSVIFLFAILLILILLMIQGVNLGKFGFYAVFLFAFISLTSFWRLGIYIFQFFNCAELVKQYIYPKIEKNVLIVTDSLKYKYDGNFQNSLFIETEKAFNLYDIVVKFANKQDNIQTDTLAEIINDAIKNLNFYIARKSKIPTNSRWFPQQYAHKKYIMSNSSELDMAQKSGTFITPQIVNNNMWFEERYINIINKCLETLFSHEHYHLYYSIVDRITALIKVLTQNNKTDEIFFIIDNLYNPFLNNVKHFDDFCAYIADAYMSMYVEIVLAFNISLKDGITEITAQKILRKNFVHNLTRLPNSIKKELENIHCKLKFEQQIEGKIKTPNWHVHDLLKNEVIEFNKMFFDGLMARIFKTIDFYFQDEIINNNPKVSISVFVRGYELYQKLSYLLTEVINLYESKELFKSQLDKFKQIRDVLLRKLIDISPFLNMAGEKEPDYVGFIYAALQKELKDIILEPGTENEEIIGSLFESMYNIVLLQLNFISEELRKTINSGKEKVLIENDMLFYLRKIEGLFIDIMDLTGYVFLFDDIYTRSLKDKVIPIWEKIIADKGLDYIINIIENYRKPPLMMVDSNYQFNLVKAVAHKIEELGLLWEGKRPFVGGTEPKPTQIYNSNLVKNICRRIGYDWKPPKGYSIFIATYLLNLSNESQKSILLKNWEISGVRKMMEIDDEEQ